MAKGASSNSGPAPDPLALRRERDEGSWLTLPRCREGDPPAWPLSEPMLLGEVAEHLQEREAELWAREWRRPQAVMWERNGQELEVALYVRSVVAAEAADAPTNARTLVRQQQEALGLSLPGLARNRWRIEDTQQPVDAKATKPRRSSRDQARGGFAVINGGVA